MDKLLILDKDGTIVTPKSGKKFVQYPEDQELLPGISSAIKHYKSNGWCLAIASNQNGITFGYKSLESTVQEFNFCLQLTDINSALFSFENGEKACYVVSGIPGYKIKQRAAKGLFTRSFRKPDIGMIHYFGFKSVGQKPNAMKIVPFYKEILFVGDCPEDEQAAKNAQVDFMWADDFRAQFINK